MGSSLCGPYVDPAFLAKGRGSRAPTVCHTPEAVKHIPIPLPKGWVCTPNRLSQHYCGVCMGAGADGGVGMSFPPLH